jgi:hypothetical protein
MWDLMVRDSASHFFTMRGLVFPHPEEGVIARVSKDKAMIAVPLFF